MVQMKNEPLSDSEKKILKNRLLKVKCPICGSINWNVDSNTSPYVNNITHFDDSALISSYSWNHMIEVECNNCGYELFFDGDKAGLSIGKYGRK